LSLEFLGLCSVSHINEVSSRIFSAPVALNKKNDTEPKYAQALALSCSVQEGVELRAERLTERGRDGGEFLREFEECVAQTGAQTRSRKQRPQTLGSAVEAIGEDPFDPIRRFLLQRGALKRAIGLRKGHRTGVRGVPQVPHHAALDNRGQIH